MTDYAKAGIVVMGALAALALLVGVIGVLLTFAPWVLVVLSTATLLVALRLAAPLILDDRRKDVS